MCVCQFFPVCLQFPLVCVRLWRIFIKPLDRHRFVPQVGTHFATSADAHLAQSLCSVEPIWICWHLFIDFVYYHATSKLCFTYWTRLYIVDLLRSPYGQEERSQWPITLSKYIYVWKNLNVSFKYPIFTLQLDRVMETLSLTCFSLFQHSLL